MRILHMASERYSIYYINVHIFRVAMVAMMAELLGL